MLEKYDANTNTSDVVPRSIWACEISTAGSGSIYIWCENRIRNKNGQILITEYTGRLMYTEGMYCMILHTAVYGTGTYYTLVFNIFRRFV